MRSPYYLINPTLPGGGEQREQEAEGAEGAGGEKRTVFPIVNPAKLTW